MKQSTIDAAVRALLSSLPDCAGGFTCSEIEALAGFLTEAGHGPEARAIVVEHSHSDEEGDMHYRKVEEDVLSALSSSVAVAFDGCHKIYLLADKGVAEAFEAEDLMPVLYLDTDTDDDLGVARDAVRGMYNMSCPLRFITRIDGDLGDNESYRTVVEQGAVWE